MEKRGKYDGRVEGRGGETENRWRKAKNRSVRRKRASRTRKADETRGNEPGDGGGGSSRRKADRILRYDSKSQKRHQNRNYI